MIAVQPQFMPGRLFSDQAAQYGRARTLTMKRSLLMFAAVSAFLVPAAAPLSAMAQERPERAHARDDGPRRSERRAPPQRDRGDMAMRPRERQETPRQSMQPRPDQARPQARPDGSRPQRPEGGRPWRP